MVPDSTPFREDNMKRMASLTAVAIMAVGTLTACSGGDAYCDKLKDYDKDEDLAEVDFQSEDGQQQLIDVMEDLESDAPDELKDDYLIVIDGFTAIREGKPEDVDPKFQAAFTAIGEDAQENCDVDMGI